MDFKYLEIPEENLSLYANAGKDLCLAYLRDNHVLTDEQYKKYSRNLCVLYQNPSWWSRLFRDDKGNPIVTANKSFYMSFIAMDEDTVEKTVKT